MALQSGYRYKEARAEVIRNFFYRLWVGNLEVAKQYLLHIDHSLIKNCKNLSEMIAYLNRKEYVITCLTLHRVMKLNISSNFVERYNNVLFAARQKRTEWAGHAMRA